MTNDVIETGPAVLRVTLPMIPVGHPDYKWTSGADVQATWHKYTGWTPPSGRWLKPAETEHTTPLWVQRRLY